MDLLVLFAGIIISLGVVMLYKIVDRGEVNDKNLYLILILGSIFIFGGFTLIFSFIPAEIVKRKIYGFILSALGFWLVFKFPAAPDHQDGDMALVGILFGIVMLVIGLYWFMF